MSSSTAKLFGLTDLHGHLSELLELMEILVSRAGLQPARDTVVFLGDYCDGGPDTSGVIDQLMRWERAYPHWVFLLGNHDDLMVDALRHGSRRYGDFAMWWDQGGREAARSYFPTVEGERALRASLGSIRRDHLDWLEARPLYHETARYIFVHAGLRPGIPLADQERHDLLWIRDDFSESNADFGQRVIFGHVSRHEPLVLPNKIGFDTMKADLGKLTAVELSGDEPVFYDQEAAAGPWR